MKRSDKEKNEIRGPRCGQTVPKDIIEGRHSFKKQKILMGNMQRSRTKDAAAVAAATIHVMAALRYFLDDHGSANGTSTTKLQPSSPNAERNVIFLS